MNLNASSTEKSNFSQITTPPYGSDIQSEICNDKNGKQSEKGVSKFIIRRELDCPDELETEWELANGFVCELMKCTINGTEEEINNLLVRKAYETSEFHCKIVLGLLFGILVSEDYENIAKQNIQYLTVIARDGFSFVVQSLRRLTIEKYHRLTGTARHRIFELLRELINLNVASVDILCSALIRQIVSSCFSESNLSLIEKVLNILSHNREWMYQSHSLVSIAIFTFLRLIADHSKPEHIEIRRAEINFCLEVFEERLDLCLNIGRDLMRVMQDLSKLTEFDLLRTKLFSEKNLCSQCQDIIQIWKCPTSKQTIQSRITPEMEKRLFFMMSEVRMGHQKRYQSWFMQTYLTNPDTDALIVDLIRYVCIVFHPTNKILSSDIVPRWAVLGWLLSCVKHEQGLFNAKLAIFYDWFFFCPTSDSVMNIEPAVLLMLHSIQKYPNLTINFLEFLCFSMEKYYPDYMEFIDNNIRLSFQEILKKGVVPSVEALLTFTKLDEKLISKARLLIGLKITINESGGALSPPGPMNPMLNTNASKKVEHPISMTLEHKSNISNQVKRSLSDSLQTSQCDTSPVIINDDDENENECNNPTKKKKEKESSNIDTEFLCKHFDESFVRCDFSTMGKSQQYKTLKTALETFLSDSIAISNELVSNFAMLLLNQMKEEFQHFDSESVFVTNSIHHCIFFSAMKCKSPKRKYLLKLIREMSNYDITQSIGCRFLSYVIMTSRGGFHVEDDGQNFGLALNGISDLNHMADKILDSVFFNLIVPWPFSSWEQIFFNGESELLKGTNILVNDLQACANLDSSVFFKLIPFVFSMFPRLLCGNLKLINLLISNILPSQVQILATHVALKRYQIFGLNIIEILKETFDWESYEQVSTWQLAKAELGNHLLLFQIKMARILSKLSPHDNPEVFVEMQLILKNTIPNCELLLAILNLPISISPSLKPNQDIISTSIMIKHDSGTGTGTGTDTPTITKTFGLFPAAVMMHWIENDTGSKFRKIFCTLIEEIVHKTNDNENKKKCFLLLYNVTKLNEIEIGLESTKKMEFFLDGHFQSCLRCIFNKYSVFKNLPEFSKLYSLLSYNKNSKKRKR